jgi:hypothetical protein
MFGPDLIIIMANLLVAGAVAAFCLRRDRGVVPEFRLADALAEPLNGRRAHN